MLTGGNDFKSERENEVVIYCPWLESEYIDGSTTKISMAYHTGDLGIVDEDGNINDEIKTQPDVHVKSTTVNEVSTKEDVCIQTTLQLIAAHGK